MLEKELLHDVAGLGLLVSLISLSVLWGAAIGG